jgi:tetratricopeptide (TPR) repeat protein
MIEVTVIRSIPIQKLRIFVVIVLTFGVQLQGAMSQSEDEAYEYNRRGMIAMSEAEFEEAIIEFQKAAVLAGDYQITGRPLVYTPIFMTAWADEKIGHIREACREFQRFLAMAPPESVEETKAEHARGYLKQHCP